MVSVKGCLRLPDLSPLSSLSKSFFISLLFNLFVLKNKNKTWLTFLIPIVIFINPPFEFLIISFGLIIVAWLLAQGILLAYKKLKKT